MIATAKRPLSTKEFVAIFDRLKAAGLSPDEIADDLGVHRVTLYRWASGIINVGRFTSMAIREYAERKIG